jgi:quinoprotein glucose dehydrogenase
MLTSKSVPSLFQGLLIYALSASGNLAFAAEPPLAKPSSKPQVAPASNEGELAIKRFSVPPGFKADLFAAEPNLANPVAFCIDERGRFYVVETFRLSTGVLDIRGRKGWPNSDFLKSATTERLAGLSDELLDVDLASRVVDDRIAMLRKYMGTKANDLTIESDRLRLIEDRDGDGKADHATVFADGFSNIADGLGAGVLARKGDVYFANIPNLWLLRDTNNDGMADFRQSLHYGYGVRMGFLGHDLHGLRFGPDGKLYFSSGDRGSNVRTKEGTVIGHPDTGDVFRCNPDGSELEVFAYGLRNPQELVFDQYGNLFTGDNNSDGGDQARWVYLVEGGDSGWRIGYQFMESPVQRGPWNAEKLWHPQWEGQAAYLVPPITNIAKGPSGVTYAPGTGLPEKFGEHFFLVDFTGSGANSGVHTFTLRPNGASFSMVDHTRFIWNILATDVDFGVEGGLYVSDWVAGWEKTGKGRLYRFYNPTNVNTPLVRNTKKFLAEGMGGRSLKELATFMTHPDMRVRQEAQFAFVEKGSEAIRTLIDLAQKDRNRLARLHAIWALGQLGAQFPGTMLALFPLLADPDGEVRAQTAKVLGERRVHRAYEGLVKMLQDPDPRAQFFAALSLGKLELKEAIGPILALLRANADRDPYLRHASVLALARLNDLDALKAKANDASRSVRMGVLLAMRRLGRPEIVTFLHDADPGLVLEAARSINDEPINAALPELAALIDQPLQSDHLLRRVLNANFRLGQAETAKALAQFASRTNAADASRAEALNELGEWPNPSGRDRIVGVWRPLTTGRDRSIPAEALRPVITEILQVAPDSVCVAAAWAAGQLVMTEVAPTLFELATNNLLSDSVRVASLRGLARLDEARLAEALKTSLVDKSEALRKAATQLQAQTKPALALGHLKATLESGSIGEKQTALAALGTIDGAAVEEIFSQWLDKLGNGQVPKELQLDLLEAAGKRPVSALKEKVERYQAAQPKDDPLLGFREALYGGDASVGKTIFFERAEVACLRCHKINGEGGEVGPNLEGIGTRQTREYILDAILYPNKQIAAGFETLLVSLKNGTAYAGILKSEDANDLVLNSPEDGIVKIKKMEIQSREKGLSSMPESMGAVLSKPDLRNLVEYLANAK